MKKMIIIFLILFSSATYSNAFSLSNGQLKMIIRNFAAVESGICNKFFEKEKATETIMAVFENPNIGWFYDNMIFNKPKNLKVFQKYENDLKEGNEELDEFTTTLLCNPVLKEP